MSPSPKLVSSSESKASPPEASPGAPHPALPAWVEPYFANLSVTFQKADAARAAGMNLVTVAKLRETSPDFAAQERSIMAAFADALESEAARRATTVPTPGPDGKIQRPFGSDRLLLRLMEHFIPGFSASQKSSTSRNTAPGRKPASSPAPTFAWATATAAHGHFTHPSKHAPANPPSNEFPQAFSSVSSLGSVSSGPSFTCPSAPTSAATALSPDQSDPSDQSDQPLRPSPSNPAPENNSLSLQPIQPCESSPCSESLPSIPPRFVSHYNALELQVLKLISENEVLKVRHKRAATRVAELEAAARKRTHLLGTSIDRIEILQRTLKDSGIPIPYRATFAGAHSPSMTDFNSPDEDCDDAPRVPIDDQSDRPIMIPQSSDTRANEAADDAESQFPSHPP